MMCVHSIWTCRERAFADQKPLDLKPAVEIYTALLVTVLDYFKEHRSKTFNEEVAMEQDLFDPETLVIKQNVHSV